MTLLHTVRSLSFPLFPGSKHVPQTGVVFQCPKRILTNGQKTLFSCFVFSGAGSRERKGGEKGDGGGRSFFCIQGPAIRRPSFRSKSKRQARPYRSQAQSEPRPRVSPIGTEASTSSPSLLGFSEPPPNGDTSSMVLVSPHRPLATPPPNS